MNRTANHIHLDPIGGIAGDMFVAAMLDAWPEHAQGVLTAVRSAGLAPSVSLALVPYCDGVLSGSRFAVSDATSDTPGAPPQTAIGAEHAHHHTHEHIAWATLRQRLQGSFLVAPVKVRAIAIFELLAEAEAAVHSTSPAEVTFHEVGAWDSVADIVAAAYLIEQVGAATWSVGALPLGSGRVNSAHGALPVPAPATALLLRGHAFFDDGHGGERVTPTGAAILRHLAPASTVGQRPRSLARIGHGFGTRRFPGLSNVLRLLAFESVEGAAAGTEPVRDRVGVLQFEVDDQTAEDLAVGLEHLRALPEVLDITQTPALGKHGRLVAGIRILTLADCMEQVTRECFEQTTTIGIRMHLEARRVLPRKEVSVDHGLRVKLVRRPGGETAKTDIAELAGAPGGHAARARRRAAAERSALAQGDDDV